MTHPRQELLSAREALTYVADYSPDVLRRLLRKYAKDADNVEKRDAVLQQIDAMSQWLTTMRRAVCDGRLGL